MSTLTASDARKTLYRLLDDAARDHEPILITGPRTNAVLISEDDWNGIQETLYLLGIPGMRDSLRKGIATPVDKCSDAPGW
jgi:antitoxin YefM